MSLKILAIDDSHTLRLFISKTLTEYFSDHEVLVAKDGKEGLNFAREKKPDLILLDYMMPDLNGNQVCEELLGENKTSRIPVVMMSSSTAELKESETRFSNVVRSIAKPFTPELLCATVSFVLNNNMQTKTATETEAVTRTISRVPAPNEGVPDLLFCGNTSHIPLRCAINLAEGSQATGVLELTLRDRQILTFFKGGKPTLVTSKDWEYYLQNQVPKLPEECMAHLDAARKEQSSSGCPIFYSLSLKNVLSRTSMHHLCDEYGKRLFSRAWLSNAMPFRFIGLNDLPPFADACPPFAGNLEEWSMEALRFVEDEALSAIAWGEPTGIPTYTRAGYERVQQIALQEDEIQFAYLVSNNFTLKEIASRMEISVEKSQEILYRFLCLDILAYWPATFLRGA